MNYQETIDFLYARLPMFTRVGAAAIKKGLDNTLAFCKSLDDPQNKFRSVHVGGTNGKGSTSHMLAAILQTAGYKTGLYTSPHLKDFRERIRINGEMIQQNEVVDFVEKSLSTIESIEPSFFEVTVALAFDHFAKHQVDIAIIEVGLGGRLDSTNVITPLLSVITNIGYDHMNLLGNTLAEIASEKAGIIKPGVPVVIGENRKDLISLFQAKAKETSSDIVITANERQMDGKWTANEYGDIVLETSTSDGQSFTMDLSGSYQLNNLSTVLSSVDQLRKFGFDITTDHLKKALSNVKELTGLAGRWQTLQKHPLIICDTGHNEDGIREVVKNIQAVPYHKLHMVIGMVKDKDISKVLTLLPKDAIYYFCQPQLERAKPAIELADEARNFGLTGDAFPTVSEALNAAKQEALAEDLIFIGGSTFVVAEIV
ncbi:bifunctional folylpolyglutamate synthase/dihydrofolate synthase [Pedobacter sp. HMF7647]|uniref:Dihydrofolate synthase/folylpolyglutamate synthase n=1 Tax=Hufsiella arboris TaxID=2695275 RepID=A0A7K1YAB3_9SPHI|nr:folylpolyglutamate synthase/dihydrofolate synthase family protein [Hufsiella arboris]MXV51370.1 bifunctional folylpolyglutamate synthase/dihydrofolate synthase [Hufsiella arboris]